jgi:hypothetical protein
MRPSRLLLIKIGSQTDALPGSGRLLSIVFRLCSVRAEKMVEDNHKRSLVRCQVRPMLTNMFPDCRQPRPTTSRSSRGRIANPRTRASDVEAEGERAATNRPSAVDTESLKWPTKCSSKVQQPHWTEPTGFDPYRPADLRERPSLTAMPSLVRRRSMAALLLASSTADLSRALIKGWAPAGKTGRNEGAKLSGPGHVKLLIWESGVRCCGIGGGAGDWRRFCRGGW